MIVIRSVQRLIVMGDEGLDGIMSSISTIAGDGTFKRCCLQHRKSYKVKKFAEVRPMALQLYLPA